MWNLGWFCRHMKQDIDKVEAWPLPKFRSMLSVALGIVSKEWESPGEE